tara:strand:+ start:24829 stop:27921 length:3093 start_codon:yes stop_codon:yes gene_type:complete
MKKQNTLLLSLFSILLSITFVFIFITSSKKLIDTDKKYYPAKVSVIEKFNSANEAINYKDILYKDLNTGNINYAQLAKAKAKVRSIMNFKSTAFSFVEEGPDNIGGRTRAIAIHPEHDNIMFAGSVSGGLFKSVNAGNNWVRVEEFDDAMINSATGTGSLGVSSIAITKDTVLYVATGGSQFEGSLDSEFSANITGDGLWYSESLTNLEFKQLSGTDNDDVHKVVADPNNSNSVYYVGKSNGLRYSQNFESINISGVGSSSKVLDFKISNDGNVMILGYTSGTRIETLVSQDGGSSWENLHDNQQLQAFGTGRSEYSISADKYFSLDLQDSVYVLYAVFASNSGTLSGVYRSEDNGTNWCQIGQYTNGFTPLTSLNGQGNYDLIILSSDDGESCILGGINLWKWQHSVGGSCLSGQWNQMTYSFAPSHIGAYTHADNHMLLYNNNGDLIVGNDGGIQIRYKEPFGSVQIDQLPLNKGYNVTQFYSMAFDGEGSVMAGAQDNGTLYKDNTLNNHWNKDFSEVNGGDGFECAISYLNNNALITTIYNGAIYRSNDRGVTMDQINSGTFTDDPFYNAIALMENPEDLNTKDSVLFSPDLAKEVGDTITYYSSNLSIPIKHVLTNPLNVYNTYDTVVIEGDTDVYVTRDSTDTLILPDYVQSYFVTQRGNGVYITRDMLRFSVNPEWWKLFNITGYNMHSYEISTDMNYVWAGSYYNGSLTRVSGLKNAYTKEAADIDEKPSSSDTLILISTGDTVTGSAVNNINFETDYLLYNYIDGSEVKYCVSTKNISLAGTICDISIDPTNPDNVCVVIGGTGGNHVYYSTNATSSNPSFSPIDGNLPDMPVFGCVIEKNPDTDEIIIGTEYGVFSTDNINGNNTEWTSNNSEIGPVPVFDICQQWRDWEDGFSNGIRRVRNSGAIYACTFGRGIWRTDNLLSVAEPIDYINQKTINELTLFPNPVKDITNLSFMLDKGSDISIQVYDLTGKIVKSIYNDYPLQQGKHNVDFSAASLPLGTYIVLLKSDFDQKVVKFIKY